MVSNAPASTDVICKLSKFRVARQFDPQSACPCNVKIPSAASQVQPPQEYGSTPGCVGREGEARRSQTVALLKAGFLLGLVRIDRRGFEMAQEGKAN